MNIEIRHKRFECLPFIGAATPSVFNLSIIFCWNKNTVYGQGPIAWILSKQNGRACKFANVC